MIENRLEQLREIMRKYNADFYLVPSVDPHRNEYVPDHWQRRSFISGFTGSAGDALIGLEQAYLWTDPRYFLQAESELDPHCYQLIKMGQVGAPDLAKWLLNQNDGLVLALDPKVVSIQLAAQLEDVISEKQGKLLYVSENWVDQIWQNQPPLPKTPIHLHATKYAGETTADKLKRVRTDLDTQHVSHLVINSLESICWLFNIRGNDIDYNPLVIANAIISTDTATLFIDSDKITPEAKAYFDKEKIDTQSYENFANALKKLEGIVLLDPASCNHWIDKHTQTEVFYQPCPITLMKALKNPTEQQGMREAHIHDGLAVIKFLSWLEQNWQDGITELSAQAKLEAFRRENPLCVDLSFNTISGFGPHGAIIHYASHQDTNILIDDSSLYLVDSGGQYPMGTTDITRTIALGQPTAEQKKHYTLVLKGHLALRGQIFPAGTCGEDLNACAHAPLWQEGLDYGHGTGHGVGCYACVHQFPPTISGRKSNIPLQPGMVVSNEPGVYFENEYGIRIENLILIKETALQSRTGHGPFYCFEDLTLVPYALNLIDQSLLNKTEINALNQYHQQVYATLAPLINNNTLKKWLKHATHTLQ